MNVPFDQVATVKRGKPDAHGVPGSPEAGRAVLPSERGIFAPTIPFLRVLTVLLGLALAMSGQAAGRTVRVGPGFGLNDTEVVVPITISALGDEAALSLTVVFNPAEVQLARVQAGPGATGAALLVNTDRAGEGLIGLSLAQSPGRTFPAGDLALAQLFFQAGAFIGTTRFDLADSLLPRLVADAQAERLPADFVGGEVGVAARTLRVGDAFGVTGREVEWRLEGVLGGTENALSFSLSFDPGELAFIGAATGADVQGAMMLANTNEMPAGRIGLMMARTGGQTFGPGTNDLLRLRFRSVGAAPATRLEFAESPVESLVADQQARPLAVRLESGLLQLSPRQVRIPTIAGPAGTVVMVPVQVVATGHENAFAFSVEFDPTKLRYVRAELGADATQGRPPEAQLAINETGREQGRVGFLVALPPGTTLRAGLQEAAKLWFEPQPGGGTFPINFGDTPVRREVTDAVGALLPAEFLGGSLAVLPPGAPRFLVHPGSLTVNEGATVVMSVQVSGQHPLLYQWRRDGLEIPGATGPALFIPDVQDKDAGAYAVVVANAHGALLSQPAVVRVRRAPVIVVPPVDTTAATGKSTTLRVEAEGTAPLTYQWWKDGIPLPGATRATLEFPSVRLEDAGFYRVVVANAASPGVTSSIARLTVIASPEVRAQPRDATVSVGSRVRFDVQATGSDPLLYQWRKNGLNIPNKTNSFLEIESVQLADAGTYTVVVANPAEVVTSDPAELLLLIEPLVPGDFFAARVALKELEGRVTGTNLLATHEIGEKDHAGKEGSRSVWYRWSAPSTRGVLKLSTVGSSFDTLLAVYTGDRVDKLLEIGSDDDRGGFFTSLLEVGVEPGTDYAIVIDGFGTYGGRFVLGYEFIPLPDPVPRIVEHPASETLSVNGSTILSVTAEGTNLRYQWYFQARPLDGATGRELPLARVTDTAIGEYVVSVQSGEGPLVWSRPATIEIGSDPTVWSSDKVSFGTPPPRPGLLKEGGGARLWRISAGPFVHQQRANTAGSTVSWLEADPGNEIGSASRWIGLIPDSTGWLIVDTEGSQIEVGVLIYSTVLLRPVEDVRVERVGTTQRWRARAFAGEEYWISIDGRGAAEGLVYVNVRFGDLPDPPVEPPVRNLNPLLGRSLRIQVPDWIKALQPPATLQWMLNGQPIGSATTNDFIVEQMTAEFRGQYELAVSNALGAVSIPVASVEVEMPLRLPAEATRLSQGVFTVQLQGNPGQSFELLSTEAWGGWTTETRGWFGSAAVTFQDAQTSRRPSRFFLLRQRDLAVVGVDPFADGRSDVLVDGGRTGQRYVLERSLNQASWESVVENTVQGAEWHYVTPPSADSAALHYRVRILPGGP